MEDTCIVDKTVVLKFHGWGGGRAAMYVNKKVPVNQWLGQIGEDWASVQLQLNSVPMTIYSAYSPCNDEINWKSPPEHLAEESPTGQDVVVGDMNLHRPLWNREGRTSPYSDIY